MTKWNIDLAIEAAKECSTKKEFRTKYRGAHALLEKNGLLDQYFVNVRRVWNEDRMRLHMIQFPNVGAFIEGDSAAYLVTRRQFPHLIDEMYPDRKNKRWTEEEVLSEIVKHERKRDFEIANNRAYTAARLYFPHVLQLLENASTYNTRCCIYIWHLVGEPNVYKVGITSESLKFERIKEVSRAANSEYEMIVFSKVGTENAKVIESVLKRAGVQHRFDRKFTGCTEFRRISPSELAACVEIISEHTIERLL